MIAVYCLISVLAGAALCLAGVFSFHLYTAVKDLSVSARLLRQVVDPLTRDRMPEKITASIQKIDSSLEALPAAIGEQTVAMDRLSAFLSVFRRNVFDANELGVEETAPTPPPAAQPPVRQPIKKPAQNKEEMTLTLPIPPGLPVVADAKGFAPEGASEVFHYDEAEAFARELQQKARDQGVETDASRTQEPTKDQMTGSEA